ncbi:MAG: hypothetical protein E6R03_10900 [Hyphomicrobiaceae bacterium]|nr:MAG: hypothetical protein E6R03_10900 [Hyphomicrobiaceae bacterium]
MKKETITITRETKQIFVVESNFAYWEDFSPIHSRVAFTPAGILSSVQAQAIDAAAGNRYLLIRPISFNDCRVLATAGAMRVGETKTIKL